jgi:hypothetical protein
MACGSNGMDTLMALGSDSLTEYQGNISSFVLMDLAE